MKHESLKKKMGLIKIERFCSLKSKRRYLNYLHLTKDLYQSKKRILQLLKDNQTVTNQPAMKETQVQSLGSEDPLEKGMATGSSILTWRIPWMEEPGRLMGLQSQTSLSN